MPPRLISVRRSGIHGRGVFALRKIRKGREIIPYRGRLLTHAEADAGGPDDGHTFLFILNDDYVIDGGQGGNSARWINHGCRPNCIAYLIESKPHDPKKDRVVIESLRDIAKGEELTYDYRIEADTGTKTEERMWICRCGHAKCRGTMLRRRRKKAKRG